MALCLCLPFSGMKGGGISCRDIRPDQMLPTVSAYRPYLCHIHMIFCFL